MPLQVTVPEFVRVFRRYLSVSPRICRLAPAGMIKGQPIVPPSHKQALVTVNKPAPFKVPELRLAEATTVFCESATVPLVIVAVSYGPGTPVGAQLAGVNQSLEAAPVQKKFVPLPFR